MDNTGAAKDKLYSTPEDVFKAALGCFERFFHAFSPWERQVYEGLHPISPMFTIAGSSYLSRMLCDSRPPPSATCTASTRPELRA